MHLFKSVLFSTLSAITVVSAFNHQTATTPFEFRRRQQKIGRGEQTSRPSRPTTQLRLAKRRVTPTKKSRQKKKEQSLESLLELETDLHARGFRYVIGSDDTGGAGCIAGPVVVASCCVMKPFSSFLPITPESPSPSESLVSPAAMDVLSKVNDCKALTATQRQEIYDIIESHPDIFAITVAQRSPKQIDDINLTRATQEAFAESIENLVDKYEFPFEDVYAVVDGKISPKLYASQREQSNSQEESNTPKFFSVRPYINGDAHVYAVALASIIARVERDAMMQDLHEQFPLYGFADHSGFGRHDHIEAIHKLGGIAGVHRMSFKQMKGR
mmetsp:Transcript_32884/g.69192  ORF Transcript_32884/g.69192 Transcript_32884/m.69192 type:complete len:329 (-) Transcript_32884:110-1096(-)|eukprot:CAMPEP_0172320832 /NCGR_PEP_ID=MMETSP1058-20130122/41570_1 /TAXON_ID=83371 /ORGANISM="Detonula confervacea, Strain CCMP 353" /LENGTH=328 /DNA_ID=CAMNT_0013036185 /DNA_START=134 /DNA_END=1120 /DNA_ORIENTATION=-